MTVRIVSEAEFGEALRERLLDLLVSGPQVGAVTGPGRSGAVAAVYASHFLGVPFIPFKHRGPDKSRGPLLIIDTATESGRTLRKAERFYSEYSPIVIAIYHEPPRVAFWYEAEKPQRYKHEVAA